MRKILILCVVFFGLFGHTYAGDDILSIKPSSGIQTQSLSWEESTRADIYKTLAKIVSSKVRISYSSLHLEFKDVKKGTDTYSNLQKLVYLDILENKKSNVLPSKNLNAYIFYSLAEKALETKIIWDSKQLIWELKKRNTLSSDINYILQIYEESISSENKTLEESKESDEILEKKEMFLDVYETLKKSHYNRDKIEEKEMLYSAMEWLANGTKDKFTAFFPPTQNKNFQDGLSGNYEWIGAYVDIVKPGELLIISPIVDGPAFKAWVKAWDIVTMVGDKKIEPENSLSEVVSWIKWPAGTSVKLKIKREWGEIKEIDVKREKIIIKEVEYKTYPYNNAFYIQIKWFWDNTYGDFVKSLEVLKKTEWIKKVILDLRNNPGGYLDVVDEMLGYFVPAWEPVSVIKYYNYTLKNQSSWYSTIDFWKYKLIILENWWTASASEILAWTIKDYFPETTIIGENSYGKWSVQTIKPYEDGSSLKYTIAKWYTWKNQVGIDGVWIKPDVEIKITDDDIKAWVDSQLEAALKY